ncbi:hypothetical protein ETR_04566 [Erwinia tracheiphila PSU-1]|nr:hypothetical protein AV903_12425 [Erwinia tracheiphila]EOS96121.1 hypothetical protein ETR_04566 [Erwinia tracheiphila PSU-1]
MRRLKIFLAGIAGVATGLILIFILFPHMALFINGPVVSNDQMDQNAILLLISFPSFAALGALMGVLLMRHRLNKKRQS